MRFQEIEISTDTERKNRRKAKTRTFSVTVLGWVTANTVWELGAASTATRPVWMAYAAPEQAAKAFTANFRSGSRASSGRRGSQSFQIPKSSPHRWCQQGHGESVITVAYLPELFHLEPGLHPPDITFVFMPPQWWLEEQAARLAPEFGDDASDAARAALFAAYLDRRSPLPIAQDLGFHLDLYRTALERSWTETALGITQPAVHERGTEAAGLERPVLCSTDHETFEQFLIQRTRNFYAEEIRRGQTRCTTDRRILPYPSGSPTQLRLDFAMAG